MGILSAVRYEGIQKMKGNILPVAPLSNNKTDNIVKDTHIRIKIIMCILKYGFI